MLQNTTNHGLEYLPGQTDILASSVWYFSVTVVCVSEYTHIHTHIHTLTLWCVFLFRLGLYLSTVISIALRALGFILS